MADTKIKWLGHAGFQITTDILKKGLGEFKIPAHKKQELQKVEGVVRVEDAVLGDFKDMAKKLEYQFLFRQVITQAIILGLGVFFTY